MKEWERQKYSILDAWGWRCGWTGCRRKTNYVHEIHSRGAGGRVEWLNSVPLCYKHHREAHAGKLDKEQLRKLAKKGRKVWG